MTQIATVTFYGNGKIMCITVGAFATRAYARDKKDGLAVRRVYAQNSLTRWFNKLDNQ